VPVLLWLLQEALSLASVSRYEPVRDAAARMQIRAGDSQRQAVAAGSVIYLDPMFPERKKAAAVKKEALMLQSLTDVQDVGDALWAWAWAQPVERIVVKRPLRAPTLGDQKPSHSLSGKAVRFDVFVRQIEQGSTR
jgi:16S rRNA (guanine1516-N2)-methyltransferase